MSSNCYYCGGHPDEVIDLRRRRDELEHELERLRGCLEAIKRATLDGRVCDDVAWFDTITTLHDYCDIALTSR